MLQNVRHTVIESHQHISVPFSLPIGLSVLDLGPMYATDRRQTKAWLNASALWRRRHNN